MAKKNRWPYAKRKELLRVLSSTHFQNTLTSEKIHALVIPEVEDDDKSQWVNTRNLIYETREVHNVPIISYNKGFFIARVIEDIERYTASKQKTAFTIINNVRHIENIFTKYHKPKRVLRRRKK